jgi:endonuclease/exonuclease/phosphatase family metal-dependent hydrolase
MQEVISCKNRYYLWGMFMDLDKILEACRMPYAFYSPNWGNRIGHGRFKVGNLILSKVPFKSTHSEFVNGRFFQIATKRGRIAHNNLNVQVVQLRNGITVVNHHGFWRPQPMGDEQSIKAFKRLAEIIKPYSDKGPLVFCGDLNLIHDAPPLRALDFMHDLTEEHGIKNTLSGLKVNTSIACDHIYVNDKIKYSNFKVVKELVSDHFGLSVEVEKK